MSIFSRIPKHFPQEHGAPNAMLFIGARVLEGIFGEPFKFDSVQNLSTYEILPTQFLRFEDYHWVVTQSTINRSKLHRNEVKDSPIRVQKIGKTIFILDGHHRYMHSKYYKKESGLSCFGHDAY